MTLPTQLRAYAQALATIGQTDGALIVDAAANELDRLAQIEARYEFLCRVTPMIYRGMFDAAIDGQVPFDRVVEQRMEARALTDEKLRDEHTRWSHAPRDAEVTSEEG